MADYDLSGLSTRSFEQLVQALAVKVLGPGTVVFGDGPDGGREATFEGPIPFPSEATSWSGYLVVQAKFLQSPKGGVSDTDWLLDQARKEFKNYRSRNTKVRKPDYYILATNVFLSNVAETGGKDRTTRAVGTLATSLGVKDFRVWDGDQLRAYLDNAADVRQAYAAWITPGDVLAAILDYLKGFTPDFMPTIRSYLQKELMADTYVRLEQAGHSADERTSLAKVFVDLPVSKQYHASSPPPSANTEGQLRIVRMIVDAGNEKLDPATALEGRRAAGRKEDSREPGRYIILGGPGQGKTTVGQFVAQLYRLCLLKTTPPHALPSEVRGILQELERQCETETISPPRARRFPLRVVLSKFADRIGKKGNGPSLLSYIAGHISARTDRNVSPEQFRQWIGAYPWLLISDGLDEVPASSNREAVLTAVRDFLVDVTAENGDVLVVATTRPQGYNNDFSAEIYQHWWLVPLNIGEALHYGQRLVEERYKADEDRQARAMERLRRAAGSTATRRLMQSPLQITILAALLDQMGQAPRERWRLFHEYYGVIYRRESEKQIEAATLLQDFRSDVDAIHYSAGLLLQVMSEEAGGSDAYLSAEQFSGIIKERLGDQGYHGQALESLAERLIAAAVERLVFLVGVEEGKVGFEIRSLQEFMAAEALASGEDDLVRRRLSHVSAIVHWRNVFLFLAGRCLAVREYLSDWVHSVCCHLNDAGGDQTLGTIRAGSRVALELLEDGAARTKPRVARLLARESLCFLEIPSDAEQERVAECYEDALRTQYEEAATRALAMEDARKWAAWPLLLGLAARQVSWAAELALKYWPTEERDLRVLFEKVGRASRNATREDRWLLRRAIEALPRLCPRDMLGLRVPARRSKAKSGTPRWFDAAMASFYPDPSRRIQAPFLLENRPRPIPIRIRIMPVKRDDPIADDVLEIPNPGSGWRAYLAAMRFVAAPGRSTLSEAFFEMAESFGELQEIGHFLNLPWPIGSVLAFGSSRDQLLACGRRAEAGEFGDLVDWLTAQERWVEKGARADDFLTMVNTPYPYDEEISKRGIPHGAFHLLDVPGSNAFEDLVAFFVKLPPGRHRVCFGREIFSVAVRAVDRQGHLPTIINNDLLKELIQYSLEDPYFLIESLCIFADIGAALESFSDVIREVCCTKPIYYMGGAGISVPNQYEKIMQGLVRRWRENTDEAWLLYPIAVLSAAGQEVGTRLELKGDKLTPREQASVVLLQALQGTFDAGSEVGLESRAVRNELLQIIPLEGFRNLVTRAPVVGEDFLHAVWAETESDETMLRERVIGALNELASRRRSALLSLEVWDSLGLPRGLRAVAAPGRAK